MWQLPAPEMTIFLMSSLMYGAAALVGLIQLSAKGRPCARALVPLISLAACLEAVVLVLRAVHIKAVPLTGLFESMLVLIIVLSLIYIFLSIAIPQVWFGSVMAWTLLIMVVMAAVVAQRASVSYSAVQLSRSARTQRLPDSQAHISLRSRIGRREKTAQKRHHSLT